MNENFRERATICRHSVSLSRQPLPSGLLLIGAHQYHHLHVSGIQIWPRSPTQQRRMRGPIYKELLYQLKLLMYSGLIRASRKCDLGSPSAALSPSTFRASYCYIILVFRPLQFRRCQMEIPRLASLSVSVVCVVRTASSVSPYCLFETYLGYIAVDIEVKLIPALHPPRANL